MAEPLPTAEIVHRIPGRTRLRIVARRGDGSYFEAVAATLSAVPGIAHVQVRPLTGSILLRHAAGLPRIAAAAEQGRLFLLAPEGRPPSDARSYARPLAPDPRLAAAAGMAALGLWQLAQGRVLPPAITLAWYAATLTGLLGADGPAGTED